MSPLGSDPRVRRWEVGLVRAAVRTCPADLRRDHGQSMVDTFVDRRGARSPGGVRRVADTVLECTDIVLEGWRWRMRARKRDGWAGGWPGSLAAVRALGRRPAWTATVDTTLAPGIGSATAVFGVVDAVAVRALPYRAPEELLRIGAVREGRPGLGSVSGPNFRDLESALPGLSAVAAMTPASVAMDTGDGPAEHVRGAYVSGGFFSTLGVDARIGRALSPADDRPGTPAVAVLGHALWLGRFGGSEVVGRTLRIDGRAVEVVGVMGPDFHPPEGAHVRGTLLWLPLVHAPLPVTERGLAFLDVVGRRAADVSPAQTVTRLEALGARVAERHGLRPVQFTTFATSPLRDETLAGSGRTLALLLGTAALLLLTACANVANLVLVRAFDRAGELAIRISLGASRARIVGTVVAESLLLGLASGAVGAGLAALALDSFAGRPPVDLPRLAEVSVDARVLAFAVFVSILVGLVVAVPPVLRLRRGGWADVGDALRGARPGSTRTRARDALVVAQAAVGTVLLTAAALLLNSLVRLDRVDPGLSSDGLYVMSVRLQDELADAPPGPEPAVALLEEVVASVGAASVTLTTGAPFTDGGWRAYVRPVGVDVDEERLRRAEVGLHQVSGGRLAAIGARLVAGRDILSSDGPEDPPVAVVSETLAREHWPGGDALGARIVLGGDGTFTQRSVVGVVAAPRYEDLRADGEQHVYVPYTQFPPSEVDLVLRVARPRDGPEVLGAARVAVQRAAPGASIRSTRSLEDAIRASSGEQRFLTAVLGAVAVIAVLLASVGLYGTLAWAVGRRRREFGVRLALGADGSRLAASVVRRGLALTLLGLALGVPVALLATRVLEGLVFGISPADAPTYALTATVFLAVGGVASWIPGRRARRTPPGECLRAE